jgi:hypothetical protein
VNWLNSQAFTLFDQQIKWSDMIGNVIGLIGLAFGWRRSIWSWPTQFLSGLILFAAFATAHLSGSAGKQIVVMVVAGYGWWQWNRGRGGAEDGHIAVRFATWRERAVLLAVAAAARSPSPPCSRRTRRCPGTPGRTRTSSSAPSSRCTPRPAAWSSSGWPGCSSTPSACR